MTPRLDNAGILAEPKVRRLTPEEMAELRKDMAESSAWAKAELKRRREKKSKKFLAWYK